MPEQFRPMLACELPAEHIDTMNFPVVASYKLDGIRCVVRNGVCVSRSNKPIPNLHVQKLFSHLEGYDGELVIGDHDEGVFRRTTSGVMSRDGEPDVKFYVFDRIVDMDQPWYRRAASVDATVTAPWLDHKTIHEPWELLEFEARALELGYEGLIVRDPNGRYKNGRSTLREGLLLKLKRFVDAEGVIVGTYEEMENLNSAELDERGYTKRSNHAENLVGKGRLGGVIVDWFGQELRIGSGFTAAERVKLWDGCDNLIGLLAKFKYFPQGGYDLPRHPVWLGVRHHDDV